MCAMKCEQWNGELKLQLYIHISSYIKNNGISDMGMGQLDNEGSATQQTAYQKSKGHTHRTDSDHLKGI